MPIVLKSDPEKIARIRIEIGDEWVEHKFAKPVPMSRARELAMHFADAMTRDPTP